MVVEARRSLPVGLGGLGRIGRWWVALVVSLCVLFGVTFAGPGVAGAATRFGERGTGAGQFEGPVGVAVDGASHDVYIADQYNHRIDTFEGSGSFLLAWGWEVNLSSPVPELQTCTVATECRRGAEGEGAGEFSGEGPQGVAVDDNESLGDLSAGDVYVEDWGNYRVEKFGSEGVFLGMFGGDVNENGTNVCLAGERCKSGIPGSGDGQFEWPYEAHGIVAGGPGGAVYVGDKARVEVFEASGAWKEDISLAGLSKEGKITSLAVDAAGDVFVKDEGVPGVREFAPGGTEVPVVFDAGSESVEGLALDPSGDLFVADSANGFHLLKYSPTGRELDSLGAGTVGSTRGIAFADTPAGEQLYVANDSASEIVTVAIPSPGPVVEDESATPGLHGAATLGAALNAEGAETTYHFEYVTDADFKASGFTGASSTAASTIGPGFEAQHVEASLPAKALTPDETYDWRVVASSECEPGRTCTTTGEAQSFRELPAAQVDGPWAANVASTSATLAARIDPLESSTEYRLEWGTTASYGHVFGGSVGEGEEYVSLAFHVQGLEPGVTYHYRLVTTSEAGTIVGSDRSFTTQLGGEELALLDGRAWELVSPANKNGALIQPINSYHVIEAAAGGGAITYQASNAVGENPVGKSNISQVLSVRGANGWRTEDISIPYSLPPEGVAAQLPEGGSPFRLFSQDLSSAVVEQEEPSTARPLAAGATERTPYLRDDLTCRAQPQSCYTPLVSPADVEPPGEQFGGAKEGEAVLIAGGSSDLNHLVVESPYALTKGASARLGVEDPENLYEWSGGSLQLVNVLPNGESRPGAYLGMQTNSSNQIAANTVSNDGRRIVWSYGRLGEEKGIELFVRDMVEKRTVEVGHSRPEFETMSSDGSRLFFRENEELFELNVDTGAQADLTAAHGPGESNAGVQDTIFGASTEGCDVGIHGECDVYFVATGVLAGANSEGNAPTGGADNLYVLHDSASGWSTVYVATLSNEDEHDWYAHSGEGKGSHSCDCRGSESNEVSSRVSPSGRYVTFMSESSLTGYDNLDAASGQPDEEVYMYDAVAKRLVCVSCNPSGARPSGVLDGAERLLVDPEDAWGPFGEGAGTTGGHWLAGMLPTWWRIFGADSTRTFYQPRSLLDDGRVFFDSPDALVSQATNGLMNVYEYEPEGVGSCGSASVTFNQRAGGCVDLLSAGTSSEESEFYDASESGEDVFFITASRLVPEDLDAAYDVYDAHVCSAAAPCSVTPVVPPPCTSGDSCKAAPSPQPAIFGAPASATFSGAGNLTQPPKSEVAKEVVKHKHKLKRKRRTRHRRPPTRRRSSAHGSAASKEGGRR